MYCKKCGKTIPDDSVFCPVCGASLENAESTETISGDVKSAPEPDDTHYVEKEPFISSERVITKEKPQKKKTAVFVILGTVFAVLAGVFLFVILPEMHLDLEYRLSKKKDEYYITGYLGSGNEVVIPDTIWGKPVTYIKENAFQGTDIKSVSIGMNVETIEKSAFQDCTKLETVKPNKYGVIGNLKVIKENAFMNCTSLTNVELPQKKRLNTYSFQNNAFYGCVSLKSISFSNVSKIGANAFYNCDSLESLKFEGNTYNALGMGDSVVLGKGAFQDCDGLTSVTINYASIPGYCFASCDNLERFTGNTISSIGQYAFEGCEKLAEVNLEETSEENIADTAFDGCTLLKPKSQINKYGATNIIGMTESEMFDLLGYDYEDYENWGGGRNYYFHQYGLHFIDAFRFGSTIEYVDVLEGGYVSSGLGGIDFVKVGMTIKEIFEYIGTQDIVLREITAPPQPGGYYKFTYNTEGYSFLFSTPHYDHEVSDPENLITDYCLVQKM